MSGDYDNDCYINWSNHIFDKRYIMIKKLGKGSFSSVWLSYDYNTNKCVAIKIFNKCDYEYGKEEIKKYCKIKDLNCSKLIICNRTFKYNEKTSKERTLYRIKFTCLKTCFRNGTAWIN